ncbi:DDO [Mytilus edulis]|uniref:DDO n=1 Tax=Mytilus edulis TaxID=6550 RepID=A0A8S3RFP5_MYTED|nr:DDO [Mytilus edulis]
MASNSEIAGEESNSTKSTTQAGAGVVGLSTAINIQKLYPRAEVTIIADKFNYETTSDGAAGIFRPTSIKTNGDLAIIREILLRVLCVLQNSVFSVVKVDAFCNLKCKKKMFYQVQAPWVKNAYFADTSTYIYPGQDDVVLGGTRHVGEESLDYSEDTFNDVLHRCCQILPECSDCEEMGGIRPHRTSIRTEIELKKVVHNVGHGGDGVALSWGVRYLLPN